MEYVIYSGTDCLILQRPGILIPRIPNANAYSPCIEPPVKNEPPEKSARREYFRELGRLGGQKTSDRKRLAARLNAGRRWARYRQKQAAALAGAANSPR